MGFFTGLAICRCPHLPSSPSSSPARWRCLQSAPSNGSPQERGKTPIHTATGGGQIGWLRFRGPFVSLRLNEEFVVIRALQTIVLSHAAIGSVQMKKWLGLTESRSQKIHRDLHAPERIVLAVSNPERAMEIIEEQRTGRNYAHGFVRTGANSIGNNL